MGADELAAATVAHRLLDDATRATTLESLEAHPTALPRDVALAAAPGVVDIVSSTAERSIFDRSGLILGRLIAEAMPDVAAVWGCAFGGKRLAKYWAAPLVTDAIQRALSPEDGQPLMLEDARSYACLCSCESPGYVRGHTVPEKAAGRTALEYMEIVRASTQILAS